MLQNWLSPLSDDFETMGYATHQLGNWIDIYDGEFPDLQETQIALLGVGSESATKVRSALYQLSFPFFGLKITDLGDLRKKELSFIIPVLKELIGSKICPILIGDHPSQIIAQYEAYQDVHTYTNLVVVDEKISFFPKQKKHKDYYLNAIINNRKSKLFHLAVLAYQYHFTNPDIIKIFDRKSFEHIRLGTIRAKLNDIEPIVRDGDLISFNLSALKQSEAPAQVQASPSGLTTEEICQLTRYAGMSDKLTSFGIYGFDKPLDVKNQTAQVIAQMIWYFLDGFYHRKQDFPSSMDGLMEYIVHFKQHDYQLTFWKSIKSGRWWIQVPDQKKKKEERHHLIPCSYNDYVLASQEELPERLWNAFKRF